MCGFWAPAHFRQEERGQSPEICGLFIEAANTFFEVHYVELYGVRPFVAQNMP
jgi:hypothetical protein